MFCTPLCARWIWFTPYWRTAANALRSDVYEAYLEAVNEAGSGGVVVICGSLYLVGTFKTRLMEEKARCN